MSQLKTKTMGAALSEDEESMEPGGRWSQSDNDFHTWQPLDDEKLENCAEQGRGLDILKLWDRSERIRSQPIPSSTIALLLRKAAAANPTYLLSESLESRIIGIRIIISKSKEKAVSAELPDPTGAKTITGSIPGLRKYLELIQEISQSGTEILKKPYFILLSASCYKGDIDLVEDVADSMRKDGYDLEVWNYGLVMKTYAEAITVETADSLLRKCDRLLSLMETDRIEINQRVLTSWTKAYSRCGRIMDIVPVLEKLRRSGHRPGIFMFSSLLRGYEIVTTPENFVEVERRCREALAWMEEEKLSTILYQWNTFIIACSKGGHLEKSIALMKEMRQKGVTPDSSTYAIIINAHSISVTPDTALESYNRCRAFMAEARDLGIELTNFHYNSLMNVCGKANLLQQAMDLLEEMEQESIIPNDVTYNTLLDIQSEHITSETVQSTFKTCQQLMSRMQKTGVTVPNDTYNSFLNICRKGRLFREAVEVYKDMRTSGVLPDIKTFNASLSVQLKTTTPETVHETLANCRFILAEMKRFGFEPPTYMYTMVLIVCRKGNLKKELREIFEEMRQKNISRDVYTYVALVDAELQSTTLETASETWKNCQKLKLLWQEDGIKENVTLYNALLNVCCNGRLFEEMDTLLDDMEKDGIRPNVSTYNTLIKTSAGSITPATTSEVWKTCYSLFNTMEREGIPPDAATYNMLIGLNSEVVTAKIAPNIYRHCRKIMNQMTQNNIVPNYFTYTTLINVCSKGEMLEEAIKVFEEMCQKGHRPTVVTYSTLIDAYAKSVTPQTAKASYQKCRDLMAAMASEGVTLNSWTYSALLNVCSRGRLLAESMFVFDEMTKKELKPNASIYNTIINGFADSMEFASPENEAVEVFIRRVFADMKREGIKPTITTYCSLQKLYGVRGDLYKAIKIFDDIEKDGLEPPYVCFYVCYKYAVLARQKNYGPIIREKMREFGVGFEDAPRKVKSIMRVLNIRS